MHQAWGIVASNSSDSIVNAVAATRGTCPLPRALILSTRAATPSATRPRSGSVGHPPPAASTPQPCFPSSPSCCALGGDNLASQELATSHMRSRLWGAPASDADIQHHPASYPISARSLMTTASPLETRSGEFSTKTNRGRISPMIRAISRHSPERSPSIPAPSPATDMS